jgi:NADH:ubiquinone oxidoreductase subunit
VHSEKSNIFYKKAILQLHKSLGYHRLRDLNITKNLFFHFLLPKEFLLFLHHPLDTPPTFGRFKPKKTRRNKKKVEAQKEKRKVESSSTNGKLPSENCGL